MIPPAIRARRAPLVLAGLLLTATAVFHLTGLSMVAGWLGGDKRNIMMLLWIAPAASWLLIAGFWLLRALRGIALDWPVLLLTAAIPLMVAIPFLTVVSPAHPGGWMLLAACLLALFSRPKRAR